MAEKHVIELKIEELKLRQEVRALKRDVKKSREELRSLVSLEKEEQQEEHNHRVKSPSTDEQPSSRRHPIRAYDRSFSTGDLDNVQDTSADLKGNIASPIPVLIAVCYPVQKRTAIPRMSHWRRAPTLSLRTGVFFTQKITATLTLTET